MNKQCQNCKNEFEITDEDTAFYRKIDVPPPTFCPECRMIRRISWRNYHSLYKRDCDLCGKQEISTFHESLPFPVYCHACYYSDKWDPLDYGREYDFSRPFFEQWAEFSATVPRPMNFNRNNTNCEYCESTSDSKNCYFTVGGYHAEDCMYCNEIIMSKNSANSSFIWMSELLYDSQNCNRCFRVNMSDHADDCMGSSYLYDCRGCSDCFGCVGLRSKSNYLWNQPLSKEEYKKALAEWDLGSYEIQKKAEKKFKEIYLSTPRKFAYIVKAEDCTGDNIEEAKSCHECFSTRSGVENCKYIFLAGLSLKDSYDVYGGGAKSELIYESNGSLGSQNTKFTMRVHQSRNVEYAEQCANLADSFGCISLRDKQYCIFNKPYSREEYKKRIAEIRDQAKKVPYKGSGEREYRYGEFFPMEISYYGYNESLAYDYFPIKKEDALSKGYVWRDEEAKDRKITLSSFDVPDHIKDVPDSIVDEVIGCEHQGKCETHRCTKAFRIIPRELKFHKAEGLALPRLCPNCRYSMHLLRRNPPQLWQRKCQCAGETSDPLPRTGIKNKELGIKDDAKNGQPATKNGEIGDDEHQESKSRGKYTNTSKNHPDHAPSEHCPNEFQTSYAPERPEIIYCETCYQAEIV